VFGDFLYELTARDQQAAFPESVLEYSISAGGFGSFNIQWQVPAGKVFLLQSLTLVSVPGGAQSVLSCGASVIRGSLNKLIHTDPFTAATPSAARRSNRDFGGAGVVLLPGDILDLGTTYDVAVVFNIFETGFTGVLLPRGSFGPGDLRRLTP